MQDLATMAGERIHMELREGWKNSTKLAENPCAVRDIRGNNYRLGYLVQGNADKNQGKIVFLFFWTHEEYNDKLWNNTKALVKRGEAMMNASTPPPIVPPIVGNSGR